jgi:hypothetical protein
MYPQFKMCCAWTQLSVVGCPRLRCGEFNSCVVLSLERTIAAIESTLYRKCDWLMLCWSRTSRGFYKLLHDIPAVYVMAIVILFFPSSLYSLGEYVKRTRGSA